MKGKRICKAEANSIDILADIGNPWMQSTYILKANVLLDW